MRSYTPPLHLLRAFVTTAQLGNVTRASELLCLTQSAVSKQLRELETCTGTALFTRSAKRLVLTPLGLQYEAALRPLLAQLENATLALLTRPVSGGGDLHLSFLPTFGAKWLIPRLPRFQQLHPQITLHFVPYVQGYDFKQRADLDASILFGSGPWPEVESDYLVGRDVVLIAPPATSKMVPLEQPADIGRCVLLQHVSVPNAWTDWCSAHGLATGIQNLVGPQLDQFQSLIRAVSAGMGIALVPRCLVADDIASGAVSAPFQKIPYADALGYHFCYPAARAHLASLQAFRRWLLAECEPDTQPGTEKTSVKGS